MDDAMCETRSVIIENSPLLQKAVRELDRLNKKEGNGDVRREILEYELLIETRIRGEQTHQDVARITSALEQLVRREKDRNKFPSVLYQLMRMPVMGWSLLGSTLLLIWLIGQLGPGLLISILKVVGFEATSADVNVVVGVVVVLLVLAAVRKYIDHINDCEKERSGALINQI